MYLIRSWRAPGAAMGLMFSVMGMFDLYDASLQSLTQAVMGSSSAGGVVGQVLNDAFIVKFFGRPGAFIIYATAYLVSLVAVTNMDIGAFLMERWERLKDRRDRLDPDASEEERKIHRQVRKLERQARKESKPVESDANPFSVGVDGMPLPEPTVRDLSVSQGKDKSSKKAKKPRKTPRRWMVTLP